MTAAVYKQNRKTRKFTQTGFKKTYCVKCGIEIPCKRMTSKARCTDCIQNDNVQMMKEGKAAARAELPGY